MRQTQKKGIGEQKSTKVLMYVLPPIIALFSLGIVATIGVYWLFNNLVSILQEIGIKHFKKEDTPAKQTQKEIPEKKDDGNDNEEKVVPTDTEDGQSNT